MHCSVRCSMKRRPYGTPAIWGGTAYPALKRGANKRCAYGAEDECPALLLGGFGVEEHAIVH